MEMSAQFNRETTDMKQAKPYVGQPLRRREIRSQFQETPSPTNPLGVKGIGESGTIGAPPTIVHAVLDALAPFGIRHLDMPLTPRKIWASLQAASTEARPPAALQQRRLQSFQVRPDQVPQPSHRSNAMLGSGVLIE
jgi:hypothetical protein